MLLSVSIQLALGACGRSDAQDQVSKVVSRLASLGSPSPHVGRGGSGVFVGRSWCAHITAGLGYLVCWEYTQTGTIPDSLKLQLVHNLLSKTDIFFFFFPLLRFRVLLNLCLFFFFWLASSCELLYYAYSWKPQLLWSECQPACWWAHLLYFICFVIQIFLRPFLSIYSQSSCAISIRVQMASVLIITFQTVTWILWNKSWLSICEPCKHRFNFIFFGYIFFFWNSGRCSLKEKFYSEELFFFFFENVANSAALILLRSTSW